MQQYQVTWKIDIDAESAIDAARKVAELYFQSKIAQGTPGSACVFICTANLGEVQVDLSKFDIDMSPQGLKAIYGDSHPRHTRHYWVSAACSDETELGYWDWVAAQIKAANE